MWNKLIYVLSSKIHNKCEIKIKLEGCNKPFCNNWVFSVWIVTWVRRDWISVNIIYKEKTFKCMLT